MAVEPPSPATKLLVIGTICAAIFYADNISTWLRGWDGWIFWLVILLFLVVSRIGTKIVIRIAADGGELPANDEMFNFPDLNERPPSPPPSPPGITTARARLDAALAGTPATARPPPPPSTPPRHTPSAAQDGGPIFRPAHGGRRRQSSPSSASLSSPPVRRIYDRRGLTCDRPPSPITRRRQQSRSH